MIKTVLLAAATELELKDIIENLGGPDDLSQFNYKNFIIEPVVTGIGLVPTSYNLMKRLSAGNKPDLVLNIGIAGAFRKDLKPGSVVGIIRDRFADFGIDNNGCFIDIHESGLIEQSVFPFSKGWIYTGREYSEVLSEELRSVTAITVNTVSGSRERINMLRGKYDSDIETMESAVFLYICALEKRPCLSIRAISNMVEPRDRGNWEIPLALKNLASGVERVLNRLGIE